MFQTVKLTLDDYNNCLTYAKKVSGKFNHFMDKRNTEIRSMDRKFDDTLKGKLAEVAVKKYLDKTFGSHRVGNIDFRVYTNGESDEGDITLDGKVINIKSSKIESHCLMIEKSRFRQDRNGRLLKLEGKEPPTYFMFVRVNADIYNPYAEIVGTISREDFWNTKKFMPRGMETGRRSFEDYLVHNKELKVSYSGGLLADNYGIHTSMLKDIKSVHNVRVKKVG